jgi:hypothetical protein
MRESEANLHGGAMQQYLHPICLSFHLVWRFSAIPISNPVFLGRLRRWRKEVAAGE